MAVDNEEAQARRRRAEQLQQDEVLQDAFNGIEAHWLNEWRDSAVDVADKRETAYTMIRSLDTFRVQFQSMVDNGELYKSYFARLMKKIGKIIFIYLSF